jgi:hypothetical protein
MSDMTELCEGIDELDKWQLVTLACMCAASVRPVIARFSRLATLQLFEEGLSAVWESARDGLANSRIVPIRAALEGLPESMCDDSTLKTYEVIVSMGVLAYALDSITKNDFASRARDACALAANCYSGYDHVFSHGNRPLKIDPRNPPQPGRLESLQIRAQLRLIERARRIGQTGDGLIEEAQTLATQLACEMSSVLPEVAEKRGWDRV